MHNWVYKLLCPFVRHSKHFTCICFLSLHWLYFCFSFHLRCLWKVCHSFNYIKSLQISHNHICESIKIFFSSYTNKFHDKDFFDNKNSASTRLRVGRCFRSNWVKCSTRKNIPLMIYWHSTRGILKKYINFKNKTIWVKICIVNKSKIIR